MTTDDLVKAYHEYKKAIARGHDVRFTNAAMCGEYIIRYRSPQAAIEHLNWLLEGDCDFPALYRHNAQMISAAIAADTKGYQS
jgi:hypothetical protein